MPICYYCHQEGHVVYECPDVKPCQNCHKKGHSSYKCREGTKVHKVAPKVPEVEQVNFFAHPDEPMVLNFDYLELDIEPNFFAYLEPDIAYLEPDIEPNFFAYLDEPNFLEPNFGPRNYVKARNKNGYGLIWWREMEDA